MFFTQRTLIISTLCSAITLAPQWVSANFTVDNGETVGGQFIFDPDSLGTINVGGTISTAGNGDEGVDVRASDTAIINNGVITTLGDNSDGISVYTTGTEIINTGSITTSGSNSVGINVRSESIITNSGEIRSDSGVAIEVSGSDTNITLEEGSQIIGDISFFGSNNTLTTTGNLQLDDNINDADTFNTDAGAGDTQIFNGNITGNGTNFNVNGAGSVILNGNNTYSGDTTINNGRLQIGGDERIADSSDLVINGATFDLNGSSETVANLSGTGGNIDIGTNGSLTVNQTDDATYAGDFSGSSVAGGITLIKNGSGTLTLSGTSNQTGRGLVEITDGVLAVSGGNAIADTFGLLTNGGTFELLSDETVRALIQGSEGQLLLNDNTLTLKNISGVLSASESAISGTGNVIIEGAGTQIFRAASTYSGQTIINDGGNLRTEDLLALGTSKVTVNSGGQLDLFNDLNISSLSGNGSVDFFLSSARELTTGLDNSSSVFSGVISGSNGRLTKAGTGTFTLSGTNIYSGATTVDDGLLAVNGSIANSATSVNSGGTLGGSGLVGDVTLNGGAIAPGNSIGTLNVDGDIDFSGGGIYEVEVNADGSSDKIIATGNALLTGGRVSVLPEPGDYAELTQYSILEAGSLSGEFDSVSVDIPEFAFLDASLDYTATDVSLNLERNDTEFGSLATTPNSVNTANALTQSFGDGLLSDITDNLLILDNSGAQRAFESLSGNQLSQASSLSLFANQRFNSLLNNRSHFLSANPGVTGNFVSAESLQALAQLQNGNLSALSDLPATAAGQDFTGGSGFWLTPQAGFGDIDATSNARGTDFNYGGLAAGYDRWFSDTALLGASLGYSETRADDVDLDSVQAAVYGRWLLNHQRYLDGSISVGRHQNDSERLVVVGNSASQAEGDYDVDSRSASLEFGQDIAFDNAMMLTPFAGLQYTHLDRESFTESGAGEANLAVDDDRQESLRSLLGVKVARSFISPSGKQWDMDASLAWVHEFADNTANTNATFAAAPAFGFKTAGPELNRDRAQVGLGVATKLSHNSSIRVGYQGEIASTDQDHSAYATFKFNW